MGGVKVKKKTILFSKRIHSLFLKKPFFFLQIPHLILKNPADKRWFSRTHSFFYREKVYPQPSDKTPNGSKQRNSSIRTRKKTSQDSRMGDFDNRQRNWKRTWLHGWKEEDNEEEENEGQATYYHHHQACL